MLDSCANRRWACSNLAVLSFKESRRKRCVGAGRPVAWKRRSPARVSTARVGQHRLGRWPGCLPSGSFRTGLFCRYRGMRCTVSLSHWPQLATLTTCGRLDTEPTIEDGGLVNRCTHKKYSIAPY